MRVWRMNDCEWVAALTKTQAIDCLVATTGIRRDEIDADEVVPLTDADMKRLTFVTEDEDESGSLKRHSFATELALITERGAVFPTYFASTEY